jgi:hypothetical protein
MRGKTGWKHISMTMSIGEIIITEDEYRRAIIRFLEICDAEPGTPEHEEAIRLTQLMEKYENMSCYERRQYN